MPAKVNLVTGVFGIQTRKVIRICAKIGAATDHGTFSYRLGYIHSVGET